MKRDIRILLIDDEPDILEFVSYNLSAEGYTVYTAKTGLEGIKEAKRVKPHLILSDIMMPEMDGIETCEKIRTIPEMKDTIFAFLTARGEDYSQMAGFEAGADDYITKPVKPKVLISKIKSLLRRLKTEESHHENKILKFNELEINLEQYCATLKNIKIELPRKEFDLLVLLTSKPEKVFKRKEILQRVWGDDVVVGDRTIDVHIKRLRDKIGEDRLVTIRGVGYKFIS